jgi:hypothetical protein
MDSIFNVKIFRQDLQDSQDYFFPGFPEESLDELFSQFSLPCAFRKKVLKNFKL